MTPEEFAMVNGYSKKYLDNIQTDYGSLKGFIASGMLKPAGHHRSSRRAREEESSPRSSPEKRGKRSRRNEKDDDDDEENDEEQDEEEGDHNEDNEEAEEDDNEDEGDDDADDKTETESHTADASTETAIRGSAKRKKKRHRDEWKRQLDSQLKSESAAAMAAANSMMAEENPPQIQADGNGVVFSTSNAFMSMDQPPKISPSAMIPAEQAQQQTIYVMSPHPSMATPPTPQHNPFAGSMSPHPGQMATIIPTVSTVTTSTSVGSSTIKSTPGVSGALSRIGNILNVRCKSTTAQLYANKYESGSKGKCILMGDEWLTPNEFEDRAGSKAKKYLSSIKCLGRPLRVYVNSGELRGTGPPPPPKGPKLNKPKPLGNMHTTTNMQPIAPAPTPIQAPPTPSHISSAPAIPQNLGMVVGQPPILLNQQQIPSSIMGGTHQNIIPGMTFTLAQPLEVRQNTQAM